MTSFLFNFFFNLMSKGQSDLMCPHFKPSKQIILTFVAPFAFGELPFIGFSGLLLSLVKISRQSLAGQIWSPTHRRRVGRGLKQHHLGHATHAAGWAELNRPDLVAYAPLSRGSHGLSPAVFFLLPWHFWPGVDWWCTNFGRSEMSRQQFLKSILAWNLLPPMRSWKLNARSSTHSRQSFLI